MLICDKEIDYMGLARKTVDKAIPLELGCSIVHREGRLFHELFRIALMLRSSARRSILFSVG